MPKNNNFIKTLIIIALSIMFGSFIFSSASANFHDAFGNPLYSIRLDKPTISKGYTVSAFEGVLKLSLVPGTLVQDTEVEVVKINEAMEMPWNLDQISDVYQFEFKNKNAYNSHKPFYIQFSYNKESNYYKEVYFYDKNYNSWRPLPTQDFPEEKFVRSRIHLPFARIAIFSNPEYMTVGRASWYSYWGGDFAASPDFPKGSRLRVFNVDNNKFVDVEINDYGPDRKKHPDRVLDLDKVAFSKIANLSQGIINIKIKPLYVAPASGKDFFGLSAGAKPELSLNSKAGIVVSEKNLSELWSKNATSSRAVASLTKLVAVHVFLSTRPSLNTQIIYHVKDEEYNYQYCAKWQSARVKLKEGDVVTVENLIYSALVGSANNAIETLVRASGLSRAQFIENMNNLVKKWGCTVTKFVEPTGLSPQNVSSAKDYAIIVREVFKNPIISKASVMTQYSFITINTKEKHILKNTDGLISLYNSYQIVGSKTGYLEEAGYCLAIKAKKGAQSIIAIVLGAPSREASFNEADKLLKYGFKKISN